MNTVDTTVNTTVNVTRPTIYLLAALTAEATVDTADGYAVLELTAEPFPAEAGYTLTVTAEAWSGAADDDGEGAPVQGLPGLAALLGCEAREEAVAAHLDGLLADVMHARWERHRDPVARA
jgi:hypothetical protein